MKVNKNNNSMLKEAITKMVVSKEKVAKVNEIPNPTHEMLGGGIGYELSDKIHLLQILNMFMFKDSFYKSGGEFLSTLESLIERIGLTEPEFLVKAIIYSRCVGSGLRSINQVAAVLALPYIRGTKYAKSLFTKWDKKNGVGGMIYRADDISSIYQVYKNLSGKMLPNSMKKGFASAIESFETYEILKYKKDLIDVINLVHPNPNKSKATVVVEDGIKMSAIKAIMTGAKVSANTWEVGLSEVGKIVSDAVKENNLSDEEKEELLKVGKGEVYRDLLASGNMGYLAMIRNIRNIENVDESLVPMVCEAISDVSKIRASKIMPHHFAMAIFSTKNVKIIKAINNVIYESLKLFSETISGNVVVMLDISGSMSGIPSLYGSIMAAMIKASLGERADFITFSYDAKYVNLKSDNFSDLFTEIKSIYVGGGTSISSALNLVLKSGKEYDRVIIISDNEANVDRTSDSYKEFLKKTKKDTKFYLLDIEPYGESSFPPHESINRYFGKTFALFDDMILHEFNANQHIDAVEAIVL